MKRVRAASKCTKMRIAHTKGAKILFTAVNHANNFKFLLSLSLWLLKLTITKCAKVGTDRDGNWCREDLACESITPPWLWPTCDNTFLSMTKLLFCPLQNSFLLTTKFFFCPWQSYFLSTTDKTLFCPWQNVFASHNSMTSQRRDWGRCNVGGLSGGVFTKEIAR